MAINTTDFLTIGRYLISSAESGGPTSFPVKRYLDVKSDNDIDIVVEENGIPGTPITLEIADIVWTLTNSVYSSADPVTPTDYTLHYDSITEVFTLNDDGIPVNFHVTRAAALTTLPSTPTEFLGLAWWIWVLIIVAILIVIAMMVIGGGFILIRR